MNKLKYLKEEEESIKNVLSHVNSQVNWEKMQMLFSKVDKFTKHRELVAAIMRYKTNEQAVAHECIVMYLIAI